MRKQAPLADATGDLREETKFLDANSVASGVRRDDAGGTTVPDASRKNHSLCLYFYICLGNLYNFMDRISSRKRKGGKGNAKKQERLDDLAATNTDPSNNVTVSVSNSDPDDPNTPKIVLDDFAPFPKDDDDQELTEVVSDETPEESKEVVSDEPPEDPLEESQEVVPDEVILEDKEVNQEQMDYYSCYPKEDKENIANPTLPKEVTENVQISYSVIESNPSDEIPEESDSNPRFIFIIPYRDRKEQYELFVKSMKEILRNVPPTAYRMFFIHQCDERPFNRGALKNIGFLVVKEKYPETYKRMTLVFNDVDTFPSDSSIITSYETVKGTVKHFYGYKYALGGIVSINASDFELINGYPNYWAWGYEDNMLAKRVHNAGITVDRSNFYHIHDKSITQIKTDLTRTVNRGEFERYIKVCNEGINSISNLKYKENEETGFIDVSQFMTEYVCKKELDRVHDIRNGNKPFTIGYSSARRAKLNLVL